MDTQKQPKLFRSHSSKTKTVLSFLVLILMGFCNSIVFAAESESDTDLLSAAELEELVGPIALYPDELMSIVLPASTYPLQIVQAARFLEKRKSDSSLKPKEDWDPSVLGLLNYPEVVAKLNDDLDWTWKLGEAVVNQQSDVMDAIQRFRNKVYDTGNLKSNDKTVVIKEKEVVRIESATPDVIYVPSYNPATVVVYQPYPYRYVYSTPYPYYYSPAATFWTGMFVGAAIGYGLNWHRYGYGHSHITVNRNVNVNRNKNVNRNVNRTGGSAWKPNRNPGNQVGRPGRPSKGGARPGSRPNQRPGSRPGDLSGTRPATRPAGGKGTKDMKGQTNRRTQTKPTQKNTSARQSSPKRNYQSHGGSFSGYKRGQDSHRYSQRGQRSRASTSSYRSSARMGGRSGFSGGGGRHRGGGGRRR